MNLDETKARGWLQIELEEPNSDAHLTAAIRWALARIAELEAGEVRTEWGVQWAPGDVDRFGEVGESYARKIVLSPPRLEGCSLVRREIRTGPWTTTTEKTP
jgi:hypothetical protein